MTTSPRETPSSRSPGRNNQLMLLRLAFVPMLAIMLAGCGTISGFKPTQGNNLESLQKYNQVSVLDFADKTKDKSSGENIRELGQHFADLIALDLKQTGAFAEVNRVESPRVDSLTVSGDITKCVKGNASLRLWVGMGAGSSYFDAIVHCSDADTGQQLGEIDVNKNSWVLGGGIAAGQTVETFMEGAAKKVADELSKAKGGVVPTAN